MQSCDNLPDRLLDRLRTLYTKTEFTKLLNAFSEKPIPSFRTNTLKTSSQRLFLQLTTLGFRIETVSWYPDAFILKNRSIRELTETDAYKKGFFYIQNLSSMVPVLALDPKPGECVLDIAAAPGSKTTHIAALMQNSGEITANDISFKRLFKLRENLTSMGVTNTKVLNLSGISFWKRLPEYFDKTLVDVPCSMEGRIRCFDQKTYQDWSVKKIKQLSQLQKYLLRSGISATKVGGTIIYSTCTLSPEENEEVIEWVMAKTPAALLVENITIANLSINPGLSAWGKKEFIYTKKTGRIFPSKFMEGFFIVKIKKLSSTSG